MLQAAAVSFMTCTCAEISPPICHKKIQVSCSNSETERSYFTNISQQLANVGRSYAGIIRMSTLHEINCEN